MQHPSRRVTLWSSTVVSQQAGTRMRRPTRHGATVCSLTGGTTMLIVRRESRRRRRTWLHLRRQNSGTGAHRSASYACQRRYSRTTICQCPLYYWPTGWHFKLPISEAARSLRGSAPKMRASRCAGTGRYATATGALHRRSHLCKTMPTGSFKLGGLSSHGATVQHGAAQAVYPTQKPYKAGERPSRTLSG